MLVADDSLLRLCVTRALELGLEDGKSAPWALMAATGRGAKACGFIVLWATLLDELDEDEIRIEDYIQAGYENRRTAYRRLADFRALFPHDPDPNRIAGLLRDLARARRERPSGSLAIAV